MSVIGIQWEVVHRGVFSRGRHTATAISERGKQQAMRMLEAKLKRMYPSWQYIDLEVKLAIN